MIKTLTTLLSTGVFLFSTSTYSSQNITDAIAPEEGTGVTEQSLVTAKQFMVAAANPYAVKAGYHILKKGGSAVDAMIATQLVLNLVEPQSSGIGGGAFVVYFDKKANKLTTWDGRETAPQKASKDLFLNKKGEPLGFYDAVVGGRSVGTPGTLMLMYTMHQRHGRLEWGELFKPAIKLATDGFKVSKRLATLIARDKERLSHYPTTAKYFYPNSQPLKQGETLTNKPFANTLSILASQGIKPFYQGDIGHDIVKTVNTTENPGTLSLADLASYQVKERPPVCLDYRQYNVCGMGPPSSGGITVNQILGMLESYNMPARSPVAAESWRLIGDASRLAFADRGLYIADTDFVEVPAGLLNKNYLAKRAKLLSGDQALANALPGTPPDTNLVARYPDESIEFPSTSHLSIVDRAGNVVSMTTTIENGFGSRIMVRGFLLNNELTDFSFLPEKDGKMVANRIEPGKRPRSSMAPTIVLKDNQPYMAIGSPGGSRIIGYVAKTLVAHLDWKLPLDKAINLPHLVNRFGTYELEAGTSAQNIVTNLNKLGYQTSIRDLNSGLHGIIITNKGLKGAADMRREGMVMGD